MPDSGLLGLDPWRWLLAGLAALLIGFSKTGLPGAGILAVPVMAWVFGARLSVGATLPLLLVGDVFAVLAYRAYADWPGLRRLLPWVGVGLLVGTLSLWALGHVTLKADPLGPVIGGIILALLALTLLQRAGRLRWQPGSGLSTGLIGVLGGFTTMISNAAGPVMGIFMTSLGYSKQQLMGTNAWTFFLFNVSKIPLLALLTWDNAAHPLVTAGSLEVNVLLAPLVVLGAWAGRAFLPRVPEGTFTTLLLILAGVAAVKLLIPN
ncbi:sulfite exporter TauE/SafE family protein [Deinococcus sp.]|uniref:sulfite exporter TauE/SafE family protein n=1 Tax=Deinococcus sp. TaxID=47478 RepID=UPI002869A6F6|nr:sulfite exporter TauE/SafE family protein [Deinococcus sp.]